MKKCKKVLSVLVAALVISTASIMPVNAAADISGTHNTLSRKSSDRTPEKNYEKGYAVKLDVNTKLNVDVGWVTDCHVKSKGSSYARTIKQSGTKNKATLKSRSIVSHIGGIGGGGISMGGSGVTVSCVGAEVTKTYDTANVCYTTDASIWRLYQYYEVHTVAYKIKDSRGKKDLVTIEASACINY